MNSVVRQTTIKTIRGIDAEKLADLYLPVRLRDFYLGSHPLIQCHLYEKASSPEEFFVLVDMEFARHETIRRKGYRPQEWKIVPIIEEELKLSETKLISGPGG